MVKGVFFNPKNTKSPRNQGHQCNSLYNHAKGVDEIRSLSAVWNQHEVLYIIKPQEDAR